MRAETWERWLRAYCEIRNHSMLQRVAEGFFLEVAKRQQSGRFFMSRFDEALIRQLLSRITEPTTYVELPVPRGMLAGYLPEGWRFGEAAYLMGCDLQTLPRPQDLSSDYEVAVEVAGGLVNMTVRTAGADLVSSGTCLAIGDEAIFDQISTDERHRRRGLGMAVVSGLAAEATKAGAKSGLLVATPQGQCLYEALGWKVLSEVSTMVSPQSIDTFVYRIDPGAYGRGFGGLPAAA